MTTPIKTGAWLYLEERDEYLRCDLYEYANRVLLARCNPYSLTRKPPNGEGMWATMHEVRDKFDEYARDRTVTYVSTAYTLHYTMRFTNGRWHDIKIA